MKSFVEIKPNSDFSIYNLPYCVFTTQQNVRLNEKTFDSMYKINADLTVKCVLLSQATKRIGVGIGEQILDLSSVTDFFPPEFTVSQF